MVVVLLVAGAAGAYYVFLGDGIGGGGLYDLAEPTVASSSYSQAELGISTRLPDSWDATKSGPQVTFAEEEPSDLYTGGKIRVRKSDSELLSVVESLGAVGQGGDPSVNAVLVEYLDRYVKNLGGTVNYKRGSVDTTTIGGRERAGACIESHALGRKRADGSSIWDKRCWEVLQNGDDWWLIHWMGALAAWEQQAPPMKVVSDNLSFSSSVDARATPEPTVADEPTRSPESQTKWEDITSLFSSEDIEFSATGNAGIFTTGSLLSIQVLDGDVAMDNLTLGRSDVPDEMRDRLEDEAGPDNKLDGWSFSAAEDHRYTVRFFFESPPEYVIGWGDIQVSSR